MVPQLSPLDLASRAPVEVPPPPHFAPPVGEIREVRTAWGKLPRGEDRLSVAQKQGLRYEDRVQQLLCGWHREYRPQAAFGFRDDSGRRVIIPDGFLWGKAKIYVFEIKLRHMPEAYWQLLHLYRPVLAVRHPQHKVVCVEVCGSYDPAMPFPCHHDLISYHELETYNGELGVLVWK